MQAICFKCGGDKQFPLRMCSHCQAIPESRREQVASMALSADCIKPKNLLRAADYIRKKQKPPRFHDSVKAKANKLVDRKLARSNSGSMSFELSESFFDFNDPTKEDSRPQMVTVHSIGKPADLDPNHKGPVSRAKSYQLLKWEIGKDISEEKFKTHMDGFGSIYVWFRWMNDQWTWKCVTKSDFETLRKVER